MPAKKDSKYKPGKIRGENVDTIIDAAEVEFATYGYRGATMMRIAERAQLPRPNIHYYFANKQALYSAILERILERWNESFDSISVTDDPAEALSRYIHAKVMLSKTHPLSSKIFATEIIQGAPHLDEYLSNQHKLWVQQHADVIRSWVDQQKMDPVDPLKLIFLIWSSTQHYADFDYQILSVLERKAYGDDYFDSVASDLSHIILKGCGLTPPH